MICRARVNFDRRRQRQFQPEVVAAAQQQVGTCEQRRPDGGQRALAVGTSQAVLVPRPADGAQQPAVLDRSTAPVARRSAGRLAGRRRRR